MTLRDLAYRLGKAAHNYRHPSWLAFQRLLRRPVITVVDRHTGLRFRCRRGADRMFGETFHARLYDVPTVPVRAGDVVVDVGANHGFVSCYFAWRGAEVWAFEPNPEVYQELLGNIAGNGLCDRIRASPWAIADRQGRAELLVSGQLGGGMSTLEPAFASGSAVAVMRRVEVETRRLQEALEPLGERRIRLLKLDCEGSELAILRSLEDGTLQRIDSIAIEYHPTAYAVSSLLDTVLGWREFHLSKAAATDMENANLFLVNERALAEWAAQTR